MSVPEHTPVEPDEFVELITEIQRRLFVYIVSLVGDQNTANDVLQNTTRVLWAKRETFAAGTDFGAWAGRCAFNQVLDFRKRQKTDRHLFDADLLHDVASEVERTAADADGRLAYLIECLDELPKDQRSIIRSRYEPGVSVDDIASKQGRTTAAISQLLYRIRNRLLDCVERKMAKEGDS